VRGVLVLVAGGVDGWVGKIVLAGEEGVDNMAGVPTPAVRACQAPQQLCR
jgi:hypothetical protein